MSTKLDKIQMIEASCLSFSVNSSNLEEVKGFSFDFSANTKADIENRIILIHLNIDIYVETAINENKFKSGAFEFGFTYRVENLEENIQIESEHKSLDKILHMSILGISFSTARGMIIPMTANTIIDRAYLPIINPA
ncbi:MAG: hypothetical protein IM574_14450, partial [Cytophagales bacterium]|nr:hypothetical protein [Cytophagales bacterium]